MTFNLENINLYTFDLEQYNLHASQIEFTCFANYQGKTFWTHIDIATYGLEWKNKRWSIYEKYEEGYKEIAQLYIIKYLSKNQEKEYELF